MKNSSKKIDKKILKSLEPLNRLNPILLDELAEKSILEDVPAGRTICRHGDKDSRRIYLISGQLEMVRPGQSKVEVIKAKTPLTRAVSENSPHTVTLKAKTASTLLYIDADLLELLMSDAPESGNAMAYEVTELASDDGDDWMLTFLQSPAFLKLPTDNIQKLLVKMDEIKVKKDQVVISQGARDDNYYIIKSGSVSVLRKPHENSANVLLAVLPTGSGFGEESLIADSTRNATIMMREDGTLMRLKKNDFLELLINPLIPYFEHSQTQEKINQGCVVIDVRNQEQVKKQPLDGAVNIPLSMLRLKFDSLNADREYLLVCDDSSQSRAAAFLMIQQGFKCSVLRNGINGAQVKVANNINEPAKVAPVPEVKAVSSPATEKAQQQLAEAKKQSEKIAQQQQLIKEARLKAEQDIIRHKKELAESRARLENKSSQLKSNQAEAEKLKQKAEQELARAQQEASANARKQKEADEARIKAEEMLKKSAEAAEQSRMAAEAEAAAIKQRALEEVEYLRAEMEAAKLKMEQDAARLKEEEALIKQSALQIKQQADEIRREAMLDAQQVREEVEATRTLLSEKLRAVEEEEKLKQQAIIAEAQKRANELAASKTEQAAKEAEAIRLKAQQEAAQLHAELETTRKQIEAEAARAIKALKQQQSTQETKEETIDVFEDAELAPAPQVVEHAKQEQVDYSSVSIPGLPTEEKIDYEAAKRKAEVIKAKLAKAKTEGASQLEPVTGISEQAISQVKIHKADDKVILEGEEDLFIFKEPEEKAAKPVNTNTAKTEPLPIKHNVGDTGFTKIPKASESINIVMQQQEVYDKNNPFLKDMKDEPVPSTSNFSQTQAGMTTAISSAKKPQQFNKQAYNKHHNSSGSNTLAIAASIIMIIAGAIFTLHATNTVKFQAIAALFNSGNDTVQPVVEFAKTKKTHTKVLRADTNVHVTKKVESKMDNIMQGWQKVLDESKNPKKLNNN